MSGDVPQASTASPRPSLRRNVTFVLLGNVVHTACQFSMLVLLARLGGTETVGQFVLGLAVVTPIFMLSGLGLRALQATDVSDQVQFRDYLGTRLATSTAAMIIVASVAMATDFGLQTTVVILTIALAKAVGSLSEIFHGQFQRLERMGLIARSLAIRGPLILIGLWLGMSIGGSLFAGTACMVVANLVVVLLHDGPSYCRVAGRFERSAFVPRFHVPTLVHIAGRSAPIGLVAGLTCLQTNIPRFFIEHYWGLAELGLFAAMASAFVAANTIIVAINQAALPRFARLYASEQDSEFRQLLKALATTAFSFAIVGLLLVKTIGTDVLAIVYGAEYAGRGDVLFWLATAWAVSIAFRPFDLALRSMRKFWARLYVRLATTALLVGATAHLVPTLGMLGAAYALTFKVALDSLASVPLACSALRRGVSVQSAGVNSAEYAIQLQRMPALAQPKLAKFRSRSPVIERSKAV